MDKRAKFEIYIDFEGNIGELSIPEIQAKLLSGILHTVIEEGLAPGGTFTREIFVYSPQSAQVISKKLFGDLDIVSRSLKIRRS